MSSNKNGLLTLGISAIAVTTMIAFPAHAQSAGDEAETASIVVTGSRIARPDQTSNSPISVVSGDVLKEQGAVNVEEALNQLPQVTPGLNANVNNGGNGTVTVDVRGLGSSRMRDEPRPRTSTVTVPLPPLLTFALRPGVTWGSWLRASSTLTAPCSFRTSPLTTLIGEFDV